MRISLLLFILTCFTIGINAQSTWQKNIFDTMHRQEIGNIDTMSDGGILIYGTTETNTLFERDFQAFRFHPDGTLDWQLMTVLPGDIQNVYEAQTLGGSMFVYNSYEMSVDGELEALVTRVNDSGQLLWSNRFKTGNESAVVYMTRISDSQVLIGGNRRVNDSTEIFLLGIDTIGAIWLDKTIRMETYTDIASLKMLNNGKIILSGITGDELSSSFLVTTKLLVAELDLNGNVLNHTLIGRPGHVFSNQTSKIIWNGTDYFIGGEYSDTVGFTQKNFALRLDDNLQMKWINGYSPSYSGFNFFQDLVSLNDGSITGIIMYEDTAVTSDMDYNFGVVNIDSSGNINWNSDYKMKLVDVPVNIFSLQDGYLVGGQTMDEIMYNQVLVNNYDYFLMKTDLMGHTGCNEIDVSYLKIPITDCVSETHSIFYDQVNWIVSNLNLTFTNSNFIEEEFCSLAGIDENDLSNDKYNVFPNPTNGELVISLSNLPSERLEAEIISLDGKILQVFSIESEIHISDISHLATGIYFLRISDMNESATIKLVKK